MRIIINWCKTNTAPISQVEIMMIAKSFMPLPTIKATLATLIRKNYIRKAINVKPISYVKLRNLHYYEYESNDYEKEVR